MERVVGKIAVTAMLALSSTAWAENDVGFQGYVLGQALAEARTVQLPADPRYGEVQLRCDGEMSSTLETDQDKAERAAGLVRCSPSVVIGSSIVPNSVSVGGGTKATVELQFLEDQLVRIRTSYDMTAAQQIADALRLKFGTPDEEQTSEIQNRAGARFERVINVWEQDGATVGLIAPAGNLRVMTVTYWTPAAEQFDARMRAQSAVSTNL